MLMTDQDEDGSHIKGLIISMLHRFWPELLEQRYLQDFNTPLIKARTRDGRQASFFDGREYAAVDPHPTPSPPPPTHQKPFPLLTPHQVRRVARCDGARRGRAMDARGRRRDQVLQGAGHVERAGSLLPCITSLHCPRALWPSPVPRVERAGGARVLWRAGPPPHAVLVGRRAGRRRHRHGLLAGDLALISFVSRPDLALISP
jgi:hypothetical protein